MISQLNSTILSGAYSSNLGEQKEVKSTSNLEKTSSVEKNRVQELKESIDSGAYKVDLQGVAEKMAQDLL